MNGQAIFTMEAMFTVHIYNGRLFQLLKGRKGLPWWSSGYKAASQCRGHRLNRWFRKIPHAAGQLCRCITRTEDYQRCALTWLHWFSQKVLQGVYFCFHVWRTCVKVKALFITSIALSTCVQKQESINFLQIPTSRVLLAARKFLRTFLCQ